MIKLRPGEPRPDDAPAVLLPVKAVPGAKRDGIVAPLGDRLKVRITAPPEAGKANRAICNLVADALGVKPGRVSIHAGHANPEKVVRIDGVEPDQVRRLWA